MRNLYIIILYIVAAMVILVMPQMNTLDASAAYGGVAEADGARENDVTSEHQDLAAQAPEDTMPQGETPPDSSSDTAASTSESRPEEQAVLQTVSPKETYKILLYRNESGVAEEIPLEDYVLGVVAAEMPSTFCHEALKAQAIAARSYAIYRIEAGYNHGGKGAAVCDSYSCCAAYISPAEAAKRWGADNAEKIIAEISRAVAATENMIVSYNGKTALTVWHSNSYQYTKSAVEVWGGNQPYLVSVSTNESNVEGYGGHGVGMSQYGAEEMAERGCSAEEILAHYYPGTVVEYIK